MADNIVLNAGSGGDTVAADDISGVKIQRVKIVVGADGVNGGDVASSNPLPVGPTKSATGTVTSVNDTNVSTTLLVSNANRLGATIYNDSTQVLYLKCGATASSTSFTVLLQPNQYWECPFSYTGVIDGIWAADAAGAARITEFT